MNHHREPNLNARESVSSETIATGLALGGPPRESR